MEIAETAIDRCVSFTKTLRKEHRMERLDFDIISLLRFILFESRESKKKFEGILCFLLSQSLKEFTGKERRSCPIFSNILNALYRLEWVDIFEVSLSRLFQFESRKTIYSICDETFNVRVLQRIELVSSRLVKWLENLMIKELDSLDIINTWRDILNYHVLEEFGSHRIGQLFEIIKEFPDSIPALEDMKECLVKTNQHDILLNSFRITLFSRLLQPGANTAEILDIYISTIKAFKILDPKGVLLESLGETVKQYLQSRSDTVRCIISSLTDDQNGDLFEELRKSNMRPIQQDDDSDDDEEINPDDWEPDPLEANPKKTSRSRKSNDILRILVNIYGSKELFVSAYRSMLADKLLQNLDYTTDKEVQTLELLKLRFGEENLQPCEIMVRDVEDSKRINLNIRKPTLTDLSDSEMEFEIDAVIVSHHFWPPFQGENFALHSKVAQAVEKFKRKYEVLRNPRSLIWNHTLGSVQLSIDINGTEREFTVTPIQATIILLFEERDRWRLDEIASRMEIPDCLVLRNVTVWVNHGVLSFSNENSELTTAESFQDSHGEYNTLNEDIETAISVEAQEQKELKVLESYIVGMLSNFGSLPIQRIHNMLSTFARSGAQPYNKTISGLSAILGKLVDKGKLEFASGNYQLIK